MNPHFTGEELEAQPGCDLLEATLQRQVLGFECRSA